MYHEYYRITENYMHPLFIVFLHEVKYQIFH